MGDTQTQHREVSRETIELANDLRDVVRRLLLRSRMVTADGSLTPTEIAVLGHLARTGGLTLSQLAAAESVRPQSLGTLVANLHKGGMISRKRDREDKRQVKLALTAAGGRAYERARVLRTTRLAEMLVAEFTQAEQQHVKDTIPLLERLCRNAEKSRQ